MNDHLSSMEEVLLTGDHLSVYGLAVCLLQAGHKVQVKSADPVTSGKQIIRCWEELPDEGNSAGLDNLRVVSSWQIQSSPALAIILSPEDLAIKQSHIAELEELLSAGAVIGVNTESFALSELQANAAHPERILGMNWVEPAHSTLFLELIRNETTREDMTDRVAELARQYWYKDPYVIRSDYGIRMPLLAALVREAFHLIENGYASVEDIDRACRNDAGYYLTFAGNLRYMDLMGTNAYGMVMKELNPELGTESSVPESFIKLVGEGRTGMAAGKGFYAYESGEKAKWEKLLREFSVEIKDLFERYPFPVHRKTPQFSDKG